MPKRDILREREEFTWKRPVLMLVAGGLMGLVLFVLGILVNR